MATIFFEARERLEPLILAAGLRLASVEPPRRGGSSAFAEWFRRDLRLRLVWEGESRAVWLESARQDGTQVISRWIDIEWSLAGERLPLDQDTSPARLDRLAGALERFLARGAPRPAPQRLAHAPDDGDTAD
ncbi:MAG: hypothetical protein NW201_00560 [Gemmatimonadales bacterium]|nr:hypothetical protein [Gemmatimonadales bacterium]